MSELLADVLVIGAGPAGSVAAALLARSGFAVRVLEREAFPRFSIGESLLACSMELLEEAGMVEAVKARGFQLKNGAAFDRNGELSEFDFAHKSSPGYSFTFQVPRAEFDATLAAEAQRQGAEIRFETEITAVDFSGGRPKVTSRSARGVEVHEASFVLDASGFGRTLPRLLGLERPSAFPPRGAIFTHVRDNTAQGDFDRQKIRIGIHPTESDIWSWLIPFSNGHASVGVVAPVDHHRARTGSPEERFWQALAAEPRLRALLSRAETVRPVGEIIGYAATVTQLHGRHFALLGNAAEFLDPVFSSGVTIALKSASLAAAVLGRQLRGDDVDWQREFAEPLNYGVETFRAFVAGWYDGSLQRVIFFQRQPDNIRRMICSVLAGYAWDRGNPYTGSQAGRRLRTLAELCRPN
ncbi:MAG TPA: NAD(P)/FAD-dependent oxidoreductase [Steroidobacteraceae bacterium]|nr:NAD(P)/FAD-dependent oxidoreductase [Steroidobacteraceae bacterium]